LVGVTPAVRQLRKRGRPYGVSQVALHSVVTALALGRNAVITDIGADDFGMGLRLTRTRLSG